MTLGAAGAATLALAGCGGDEGGGGSASGSGGDTAKAKVAFLMPDQSSTRYEKQDNPLFQKRMKALCAGCEVIYQNADNSPAKQQQQATSAITQGVKVLVVDPVDAASMASVVSQARSRGIGVIAYDRPFPDLKVDFYVSFDNKRLGEQLSASLMEHLEQTGKANQGGVLQINGSPTDAAAGLIKEGMSAAIDKAGVRKLAEYDTPDWTPAKAQNWATGQVSRFGKQIVGVVAANDGTGGGAISAFKAADVKPVPPVTGNDAELAAQQRIVSGDQYNTINKPIKIVASATAEVAWGLINGRKPKATAELFGSPSQLFTPAVVTRENLKAQMIDSGLTKPSELCTKPYAADCRKLGIAAN